jgi:hypothetical protein
MSQGLAPRPYIVRPLTLTLQSATHPSSLTVQRYRKPRQSAAGARLPKANALPSHEGQSERQSRIAQQLPLLPRSPRALQRPLRLPAPPPRAAVAAPSWRPSMRGTPN